MAITSGRVLRVLSEMARDPRRTWKRLGRRGKDTLRSVVADRATRQFITHNRKVWEKGWAPVHSERLVLVDLYGVGETEIARSYFLNLLASRHGAAIRSFSGKQGSRRLRQLYRSFNVDGHIVTSLTKEQERRRDDIYARVRSRIRSKDDLFKLEVLGAWIGIDVYETYLRRRHATVFLEDPELYATLREGIGLLIFWQDFFLQYDVAAVVVSHDCYMNFDIPCKVAYGAGVPVYSPNPVYLIRLTEPHSTHAYFPRYREMFRRLPLEQQAAGRALAKHQLERRFNGEVGVDMPYATKSAFLRPSNGSRVLSTSSDFKVLICSHCFYDNPHGYGNMLFVDFYEWLRYLGQISERTTYDWYLKVHPDPLPGTLEAIGGLLRSFPRITLVPHETSHHQLVSEGIGFVLTAFGTVGHEYPALGVPVMNAGYNPRIAYGFNWHPASVDEYGEYLLHLPDLKKPIDLAEIYEFYFMHYYYTYVDDLVFRSYRQMEQELPMRDRLESGVFGYFMAQFDSQQHERIIQRMATFLESGQRYYFMRGPE